MFVAAPFSVRSFSLAIRRMTMTFLGTFVFGTLILGFAANLMFGLSRNSAQDMTVSTGQCGSTSTSTSCRMAEELASREVSTHHAAGLLCTIKPELTDVVLFQYSAGQHVAILTFDDALAAAGQRLGRVQRYCR